MTKSCIPASTDLPEHKICMSIEFGQPGLVKQLARCFPSPLGKAPGVKFRGLGRAADNRSPESSLLIEHSVVKIADHFGLPSTRFPPLSKAGKGRRSPGLPVDVQLSEEEWRKNAAQSHLLQSLYYSKINTKQHQISSTG